MVWRARTWQQQKPVLLMTALLGLLSFAAHASASGLDEIENELAKAIEEGSSGSVTDPYSRLKDRHRRQLFKGSGLSIDDITQQLTDIPVSLQVEVRLVGFDKGGRFNLDVNAETMLKYLRALRVETDTVALSPVLTALPAYPEIQWVVTKGSRDLVTRLNTALTTAQQEAQAAAGGGNLIAQAGGPLLVPHHVVDAVVRKDAAALEYERRLHNQRQPVLTFYMLNLQKADDVWQYAYSYGPGKAHEPGFCPGAHWAGGSHDDATHYVWLDINAGPVQYGPGQGLKGQVFAHTMPRPAEFKPAALPQALLPPLAAAALSVTQHYVWPPLAHMSVPDLAYAPHVEVVVVHIQESVLESRTRLQQHDLQAALQGAVGEHQRISVKEAFVAMAECPLCNEAYSSSLRVQTTRDLDSELIQANHRPVLDPALLHARLARHGDAICGQAGVHLSNDPATRKVLPVFLFDLESTSSANVPGSGGGGASAAYVPTLFVGGAKAVAYPDMVLAVSSRVGGTYPEQATCGYDRVLGSSTTITRDILAAVLTSGWGLVNTSTLYTSATGVEANYVWSVGPTPWGPLSSLKAVPTPLAALMPRNLALAALNTHAAKLGLVMRGFAKLSKSGKLDRHAAGEHLNRVVARTNVAMFKTRKVSAALSAGDYWTALKYAQSLQYEVMHLERAAARVARSLQGKLECRVGGPGLLDVWWAPAAAVALWPVAMWLRRRMYRPKWDKLY